MSSKFLLRFDDICPTMNWPVWEKLEAVMNEEGIRPILSVIPDNQDPALHEAPRNELFWERVRGWQAQGWTIGLHGYQHRYVSRNAGIVGLKKYSEFAGVSAAEQRNKLAKGLAIFKREGVKAECWVAPAHSFDEVTVKLLAELGVRTISDGLSLLPFRDAQNVVWVPQQLWKFRYVPFGVWTVCIHSDDELYLQPDYFLRSIREYKSAITNLPEVVAAYSQRHHSVADSAFAQLWHLAIRAKRAMIPAPGNRRPDAEVETNSETDTPHRLNAAL
jgi:predicted deacetylase